MAAAGGTVDDKTIPEILTGLRALLRAIDDGRMSCSAAYRNRLQGAVLALESLASRSADNGD
ncbi:MAG: hypothetical protein JO287_15195 [Pseudonocardiales bacterium]|nr:hypothetical protein [Pseudonocardiales bacterium]